MQVNDVLALSAPLEAIVSKAGELARATARQPFRRWTKGTEGSPVTEGDIVVNDFLHGQLSKLVDSAAWLSEESHDHLPGPVSPLVWIVDPIDGTRAYISGRADWTIAVALAEHGRPQIAALYAPITDEMFLAVRGAGATLNGMTIHVSAGETLAGARLAGPKSYVDRLLRISPAIVPQPKVHSLALRIARVAQGSFEAALASGGSHDWDLAAANLLVLEAGGALTDFAGQEPKYNEPRAAYGALVAAGRARHAAIIELVRDREIEFA